MHTSESKKQPIPKPNKHSLTSTTGDNSLLRKTLNFSCPAVLLFNMLLGQKTQSYPSFHRHSDSAVSASGRPRSDQIRHCNENILFPINSECEYCVQTAEKQTPCFKKLKTKSTFGETQLSQFSLHVYRDQTNSL